MSTHSASTDIDGWSNPAVSRALWTVAVVWFAAAAALGASSFLAEHRQYTFVFVLAPMIAFGIAFATLSAL